MVVSTTVSLPVAWMCLGEFILLASYHIAILGAAIGLTIFAGELLLLKTGIRIRVDADGITRRCFLIFPLRYPWREIQSAEYQLEGPFCRAIKVNLMTGKHFSIPATFSNFEDLLKLLEDRQLLRASAPASSISKTLNSHGMVFESKVCFAIGAILMLWAVIHAV